MACTTESEGAFQQISKQREQNEISSFLGCRKALGMGKRSMNHHTTSQLNFQGKLK